MIFNILSREDLDEEVRGALTEVVGHHNIQQWLPTVIAQLDHPSPYIRFWSCNALRWLNPPNLEELMAPLFNDHTMGWGGETVAETARRAIEKNQE